VAILGEGTTTMAGFRNAWLMVSLFAVTTAAFRLPLLPKARADPT